MLSPFARNAIVLGLLSAVGPFAIDMYLPALPAIAADLNASTAATQATLIAFFISFGLCQLIFGPISDLVGRKPPLYFGLATFMLGSVGCAAAPSIEWLIAFRFLQGIGAASVAVMPRAIIRDLHTGIEATRLMSLVMLVFSVSPVLAPLAGSALIVPFGWRAVFVGVTVVSLLGMALVATSLRETRPLEHRLNTNLGSMVASLGVLVRDWRFLGTTLIGGLGIASFFSFLASSSFVYIDHFGLTPTQYSLAFSVNAIGFIGASQFSATLGSRYGMTRVITVAVSLYALFAVLLFAAIAAGADSLLVMMPLLFVAYAFLGLVVPASMVLALEHHGPIAGMAAALGGTLQMVTGGLVVAAVSQFFDGTALPMVTGIAVCAVGALVLSLVTLPGHGRVVQPAE